MSISETKNHRSVSYGPRDSHHLTILSKEETQWKRTSKIKTSPSATFGKSQRNSEQKKRVPGPGSYELDKTTFQKGFVAFKGNKKIRFHTDSPGPGAYQPKSVFPTKRFSFDKSEFHQKIEPVPSPATYDLRETKSHGISFSREERNLTPEKEKIVLPGPGKYDSSKGFTHQNEFSFTRTKKFFENMQESQEKVINPGPGAYELSKSRNIIKSTKFAKAIRTFQQDDKLPGVGSYNLDKTTLLNRGGIISAQKRSYDYNNEVPGPGNYNNVPIDSIKKKDVVVIINRSRQNSSEKQQRIPGPGSYFKQKLGNDKIVGGAFGKDSRSNRKQIIVPNLSKTTNILFSKLSKQDYSANEASNNLHRLSISDNRHNVFDQIRIDHKTGSVQI